LKVFSEKGKIQKARMKSGKRPIYIIYFTLVALYVIIIIGYFFIVPPARIIPDTTDIILTLNKFNNWVNETTVKIQNPDGRSIVTNPSKEVPEFVNVTAYPKDKTSSIIVTANGSKYISLYNQTFIGDIFLKDNQDKKDLLKIDLKLNLMSNISGVTPGKVK
jgi:hypothetical protein